MSYHFMGAKPGVWFNFLKEHAQDIDMAFLGKAFYVTVSVVLHMPLMLIEWLWFRKAIAETKVAPPLFVIAHWRSGTTFAHNLLTSDPRWGFVSTYQCYFPMLSLSGAARWLLSSLLPKTRPFDSLKMGNDMPQEESFGLVNVCTNAYYRGWYLPKFMKQFFHKGCILDDLTDAEQNEWEDAYMTMLKKATLAHGGKPIVLKNPPNTVRIRQILKLFPGAKFVFIKRNPYHVYASMMRMMTKEIPRVQLQHDTLEERRENILYVYRAMIERYLADRALIPKGQLTEVRFEEMVEEPLDHLRRIYADLDLFPEDGGAVPRSVHDFIASVSGHTRGTVKISDEDAEAVRTQWGKAFEAFEYPTAIEY